MKCSLHLLVSLTLAFNLSSALADSHNGKPGKNPAASSNVEASKPSKDDPRDRAPTQSGKRANDDTSGDQERDRDWDFDDVLNDNGDANGQPGRGNERSREMLERRDERKEAKSEYRSERVPGQEGQGNKDRPEDDKDKDADKPWYDIF